MGCCQALARLGIADFDQSFRFRIATDHRDIGDRGNHGGGHTGLSHRREHGPVDIAGAARPSGVRVHIDDHTPFHTGSSARWPQLDPGSVRALP